MLGLNPSMRFYLCEGPVDMRKGIFTLAELVRKIMGKEPSAGDIFHLFEQGPAEHQNPSS